MLCGRETCTFVGVAFIAALIRFIPTSLAYKNKNNGDKSYRRKSMRAANEKLIIINKLGPYMEVKAYTIWLCNVTHCLSNMCQCRN